MVCRRAGYAPWGMTWNDMVGRRGAIPCLKPLNIRVPTSPMMGATKTVLDGVGGLAGWWSELGWIGKITTVVVGGLGTFSVAAIAYALTPDAMGLACWAGAMAAVGLGRARRRVLDGVPG